MNILKYSLILALSLLPFTSSALAQRSKTTAKKPAATNVTTTNALELSEGAEKVSIQIKNVTKFLYMLGGIAIRIEDLDREAKKGTVSRPALDENQANKQDIMQAIRNLRAGIAVLEVEFRTKPALKKYLPKIQGATTITAECEDLAAIGRFSDSGKPLLDLVEKLADTLAVLR